MWEHKKIQNLNDYFAQLQNRCGKEVYFYRIDGYSEEISDFLKKFYHMARKNGVVLEGKLQNPDEKNLAYYNEIMGMDFRTDAEFIYNSLEKWLPRMKDCQRRSVARSMYGVLDGMRQAGKTDNMLKNAYIKFMCWLYYKFERVVNQLGENDIPKILYEGEISNYELMILSVLSKAGCDVVLLQYQGDDHYLKLDPGSLLSEKWEKNNMSRFPADFRIKKIREEIQKDAGYQKLYGQMPEVNNGTNAWIKGNGLEDIREPVRNRGKDSRFYYNCYCRISGVEDKLMYAGELLRLQQEIKSSGRKLLILNKEIPRPTNEEIALIKRENYAGVEQMISGLAKNIRYHRKAQLQKVIHKIFVDLMIKESRKENVSLNRLINKAVYLLCWLQRYYGQLFSEWQMPEISCFIYLGGCRNENEAFFLSFLARLPVDVLILCPDLNTGCCLEDELLYEVRYPESLSIERFPEENRQATIGTAAYHAQRELDTLMYSDSGMYRNHQYGKANVINLQTMYEEIKILWDQELKYRPNFSTGEDFVNVPVIYAKISGVKDGMVKSYWDQVKELVTPDTLFIREAPYLSSEDENPIKAHALKFYKNGKLQRQIIKNHPDYSYGILREEMQEYILDKLQIMLEQKLIKGIGENGTEYTVISQILHLPKDVVRMIQKFDFTRKNPKLIYVNTTEKILSLEDSVMIAFLNLIGFDVIFFVPTGYQCIEKFFSYNIMEEHQIGEYLYDLQVPDLTHRSSQHSRRNWRDKIFKRGSRNGT